MKRLAWALAPVVLFAPASARAVTQIEGEYQLQLDIRKQDRFFPWDFESNNNDTWAASQFRIFSAPRAGVEAFVRFEADWNTGDNNTDRPRYQYRESHVRFYKEFETPWSRPTAEAYLFSRQDRFWVENHLIQVVQTDPSKDGDNAQGIRFNLKNERGEDFFTYILSDFSSQSRVGGGTDPASSDDAHILRLRRSFLDGDLRAGTTYNRKVESQEGETGYNEVWALDFRYTMRGVGYYLEYANSKRVGVGAPDEDRFHLGDWEIDRFAGALPRNAALKAEIRSLGIGTPKLGYYNIAPLYYYYGPDFADFLGDGTSDLVGWKLNSWYLLPKRAITVTLEYEEWEKYVFEKKTYSRWFAELYTEYVNGFTSKIWYSRARTVDTSNPLFEEVTKNYDLFAEVQVESRLAWMRLQGKLKDLETNIKKELVSLEASVNITDKLKVYNRYVFGNDAARLRKGLFTELQYRPQQNMELFLSYGPFWIGDSDNPVDDGDLAGGADNKDMVRVILKGNF